MIFSKKLKNFISIKHGFFNRKGGVSSGIYNSLNCGIGSNDKKKNVLKNLKIVSKKIGCSEKKLILLHQVHSNKFVHIDKNYNFKNYQDSWVKLMDYVIEKHGSWETRKGYKRWHLKEIA